jgi:hypothetical protein
MQVLQVAESKQTTQRGRPAAAAGASITDNRTIPR